MKKPAKQKPQEEKSIDILKKVAKRVEEATIDISDIKSDFKMVSLRLSNVEYNTKMMKVDIEKMRDEIEAMKKDIREVKGNTEGLIEATGHILKEAVTHDEYNSLSQRIASLEQS